MATTATVHRGRTGSPTESMLSAQPAGIQRLCNWPSNEEPTPCSPRNPNTIGTNCWIMALSIPSAEKADCTPLMDEILDSRLSLRLLPPPSRLDRPQVSLIRALHVSLPR